ncbi:MAG: EamA family transporter [Betaproteobacteria bacterium]|nr:EamA family transporter [Betaproteobacteria bacterium]
MTLGVTAAVLAAALLHATWNALIKANQDVVFDTALVVAGAALVAALLLPWLAAPATPSWPYLAASAVVHQGYFALLAAAYRRGDLSFAYPLMRGLPPLLVALGGIVLLPDPRSAWLWSGIAAISLGVLWIGGLHPRQLLTRMRPAAFAVGNAFVIAAYTLIDGIGVRLSGSAVSYGLWLFFLIAWPYAGVALWSRRAALGAHLRRHWWRGLLGGTLSIAAYLIALWAMTQAPIAAVAALRETSVIFAAVIGAWLLKEPFGRHRIVGACLVVVGIALLKA